MRMFRVEGEVWLSRPVEEVFSFFADASNLQMITPPWLRIEVLTPMPIDLKKGTLINYHMRLYGIPMRWQSEITVWEPPYRFVDSQRRGPYRRWVHEHIFEEHEGGTIARDRLEYAVPGGILTQKLLIGRVVRRIFQYRRRRLQELFGATRSRSMEGARQGGA